MQTVNKSSLNSGIADKKIYNISDLELCTIASFLPILKAAQILKLNKMSHLNFFTRHIQQYIEKTTVIQMIHDHVLLKPIHDHIIYPWKLRSIQEIIQTPYNTKNYFYPNSTILRLYWSKLLQVHWKHEKLKIFQKLLNKIHSYQTYHCQDCGWLLPENDFPDGLHQQCELCQYNKKYIIHITNQSGLYIPKFIKR